MAITEQIQIYANIDQIEAENGVQNLILSGFDVGQIYSEVTFDEWMSAIMANDDFSKLVEYVTKELEHENDN